MTNRTLHIDYGNKPSLDGIKLLFVLLPEAFENISSMKSSVFRLESRLPNSTLVLKNSKEALPLADMGNAICMPTLPFSSKCEMMRRHVSSGYKSLVTWFSGDPVTEFS